MTLMVTSRNTYWLGHTRGRSWRRLMGRRRTARGDWPTLEEEEALREVEYDLAQDLDAHGEEMSYRPTSDEGEDQEMGDPDEGDEQHGAKETVISHSRCQIQDPVNQKCRRCHFPRLQKRLKSTRRSTRRSPCPSAYHWPRRAHQKSLPGRKNCLAC